jgi:hypothetical protein
VTHEPGSSMPMSERMQSLLARAVDDQRSDQRSLADALDEVRAQLAALSQEIAASRQQPADQHQPSAVTALTVELRESSRRAADRLDNVARMVAQRGEDLVALQNSVSALSEQLRAQGETVTGLAGSVDGVGQHVSGIATYLGDRARDDSARIIALEQRLVTLQNDMTAVGSHLSGLTEAAAASAGDGLDDRIRSIVAGALVGTERRLAAHIEDSVLALAEAMLRRRPAGSRPEEVQPPVEQVQPEAATTAVPPVAAPAADPLPAEPAESAAAAEPTASQPLTDPSPEVEGLPAGEAPSPDQTMSADQTGSPDRTVDLTDGQIMTSNAANRESADGGSAAGQASNGQNPKVPASWTTVMPDDQRRRGWFRSRE